MEQPAFRSNFRESNEHRSIFALCPMLTEQCSVGFGVPQFYVGHTVGEEVGPSSYRAVSGILIWIEDDVIGPMKGR